MWTTYKNGNYTVLLNLHNGTKIRYNEEDYLIPNRPESMDVKITNKCEHSCLFCHESSIVNGKEAELKVLHNFVSKLDPYTEIACGGGNLMLNPSHTEYFLTLLKEQKCIASITLHQEDFVNYFDIVQNWINKKLVYGIGVSINNYANEKLLEYLDQCENAVIHTIVGLVTKKDIEYLSNKGYKILFLGYKRFRRGNKYYVAKQKEIQQNIDWLKHDILKLTDKFKVVSFDNLALEQLDIEDKISTNEWNIFYMGNDGNYTFYVDLTEEVYAKNSTSIIRFPILNKTAKEMFEDVRSLNDSN